MTWLRHFLHYLIIASIFFILCGQTKIDNGPKDLPSSFSNLLDSFRHADNLKEWIATWNEYIGEDPVHRLSLYEQARSTTWRKPTNDDESIELLSIFINEGHDQKNAGNILRSIEAYEKAFRFYFEKPIQGVEQQIIEY